MFAVLCLKETLKVKVFGVDETAPLCWAEKMIGAIPVFETKTDAESYANGGFEVLELVEKQKEIIC